MILRQFGSGILVERFFGPPVTKGVLRPPRIILTRQDKRSSPAAIFAVTPFTAIHQQDL